MKKILCFMMFVLLLVSCSKDSGEEDGLTSNYIEVAGVRHQIDKFVIENESEFYIGSKKDGTYISFGYTWCRVPIGEKIYFVETYEELEYFELVDNYRKCKLTYGSFSIVFFLPIAYNFKSAAKIRNIFVIIKCFGNKLVTNE